MDPSSGTSGRVRTAEELTDWFAQGGPTLVALSGGVDSASVARLAYAAAPDRVRAATLVGPAVSSAEVERSLAVVRSIGIPHDLVPVDPLALDGYRTNPSNRCYFCRTAETSALRRFGEPLGIARYVDGVHRDDLGDDRPGIRALDEARFEHPLLWAGWGKSEVRAYARTIGLPNWDLPADACLASRVPHGTAIDATLLQRVEGAESDLRARGYTRVRVRIEALGARVEVDPDELPRLTRPEEAEAVIAGLLRRGFSSVTIDPRGYVRRANS